MFRLTEAAKLCADRPKGMSAKQYRLFNPAGAQRLADYMAEHRAEIIQELAENWVRSRSDMQYVTVVDLSTYRPASGTAHFHIYTVGPEHPAAQ